MHLPSSFETSLAYLEHVVSCLANLSRTLVVKFLEFAMSSRTSRAVCAALSLIMADGAKSTLASGSNRCQV